MKSCHFPRHTPASKGTKPRQLTKGPMGSNCALGAGLKMISGGFMHSYDLNIHREYT